MWGIKTFINISIKYTLCVFSLFLGTESAAESAMHEFLLFSSLETIGQQTTAKIGAKWASGGLDRSAFVAQVSAGTGLTRDAKFSQEAEILTGYQWVGQKLMLSTLAGVRLRPYAAMPAAPKIQIDTIYMPRPDMRIMTTFIVETGPDSIWFRNAVGWKFGQSEIVIGPETGLKLAKNARHNWLGLHVSGIEAFGLWWRVSGGMTQNLLYRHYGAYAQIVSVKRF
jgi:hypothetical protein